MQIKTTLKTTTHNNYTLFLTVQSSLVAQIVKNLPAMQETWVQSLGQEDPLEMGMVTHSSILAWRISWTEESGGLQSIGLQRLKQLACTHNSSKIILFIVCKLKMDTKILLSVQSLSHVRLFRPHELQHTRSPCPSPTPRVHSNSCRWCHPAISSSVAPFSCLQSFPASGSV